MQIDIPFKLEYQTEQSVPIGDVIDSLISVRMLLEEGGYNLGHFVSDLTVEKVRVSVRSISQESPLKEIFLVTLILTFQKQLDEEIPSAIENLTGIPIPENLDSIVTVSAMNVAFFGASYAKDVISKLTTKSILSKKLDDLVDELAIQTGVTAQSIHRKLDEKYKTKSRLKTLALTAIKLFRPSKSQPGSGIQFGSKRIEPQLIDEIPQVFLLEEAIKQEKSKSYADVELDIHAQDKDSERAGWAAIPNGICTKRLRMKLVDGVTPDRLWNRDKVRADIIVKSKRVGIDFEPYEIHLLSVLD